MQQTAFIYFVVGLVLCAVGELTEKYNGEQYTNRPIWRRLLDYLTAGVAWPLFILVGVAVFLYNPLRRS